MSPINLVNRYKDVLKNCRLRNRGVLLSVVKAVMAKTILQSVSVMSLVWTLFMPHDVHAATNYTEEAENSSNFIDIINAQEAYNQGYTGTGVTVGVIDTAVSTSHSELLDKVYTIDSYDGDTVYISDFNYSLHGSHVAGIVAASLDGEGMHGVAYNASILNAAIFGIAAEDAYTYLTFDMDELYTNYTDVQIFNNSWGSAYYPYTVASDEYDATQMWEYYNASYSSMLDVVLPLAKYAFDNTDVVMVWAAGNDGQNVTSYEAIIPRYLGSSLNNWISVGSLDSSCITAADDGSLTLSQGGISFYSNLAGGAERWTVFAPGSYIYSLDSSTGEYVTFSGTSMAAPVVSGALALVLEKFPWMTGSQLASTILSTANDNITIENDCFFQLSTNYVYDEDNDIWDEISSLTFNYYAGDGSTSYDLNSADDVAKIKELLKEAIGNNSAAWEMYLGLTEDSIDEFDFSTITLQAYYSLESIIGQGIVDIAKAMGGIAELDANRMTADYIQEITELDGESHAIESFDTKGCTAVFSNDISGFAWDDSYHSSDYQYYDGEGEVQYTDYNADALGLYVVGDLIGIEKAGEGTLVLSGYNSYEGATLVTGGILGLMQADGDSSGTLTNSDVVVRSGGTFVGDGTVSQSLINNGIVAPGDFLISWYSDLYGSSDANILTVSTYTQGSDGALHIYFDSNGDYGKLSTTYASLDGVLNFVASSDFYENNSTYSLCNIITGEVSGVFDNVGTYITSPTLTWSVNTVDADAYSYDVAVQRSDNAYSQYAFNASSRSLGVALSGIANNASLSQDAKNLFTALDFSNVNGGEVQSALSTLSPASYNNLTQASLNQQTSFSGMVFSQILSAHRQRTNQSHASTIRDKKIANGEDLGLALLASNGDAILPVQTPTWEFWASAIGSYSKQNSSSLASSNWSSSHFGLMVGADKIVSDALRLGFHIIGARSSTDYEGLHHAETDSTAFYLGLQALYDFSALSVISEQNLLDGVYISGLLRAGFEENKMERTVSVNGYAGHNSSDWMDKSLSAMLAIGKDWDVSDYYFGPFMRLDGTYMRRPDITESGSSTRLHIEGDDYFSLPLSLGGHFGVNMETFRGQKVHLDVLFAWQHQLLDDSYESKAHFADFSGYSFMTSSDTRGKDSFAMEGTMKFNASESVSFQFNAGTNIYNSKDYDINGGMTVMWAF